MSVMLEEVEWRAQAWAPQPVLDLPMLCETITRHPENMQHTHLDRMLRRHPHLLGTRVARIPETLRDGLVWGI